DRPRTLITPYPALGAPPHTRGSTLSFLDLAIAGGGSPAYAGIDPAPGQEDRASYGLPRIRGDRPGLREFRRPIPSAPPHTRGSTQRPVLRAWGGEGSPAYAGIDPSGRPSNNP